MTMIKILALDGGGIRGALTAALLQRLDEERPGFIRQLDLIAGPSIGAILALSLADGYTPAELSALFESEGERIFADSLMDDIRDVGFMRGAKYGNRNLYAVLHERFGEKRLQDLQKKVLVSSFDLDNEGAKGRPRMWKPKFFHNFAGDDSDGCELIADVASRSAAAPFYFPLYQGYVDGFIVANNPSMCAVAQILKEGIADLQSIALLSLGTGLNLRYFPEKDDDWGWRKWMFQFQFRQLRFYVMPLIYMMWEAGVDLANYQCQQLLKE